MGIKVKWQEKGGAHFLVDDEGEIRGKVTPETVGSWEAFLDGSYLGEFWDRDSAKERVERQMRATPYELVKDGE